MIKKGRKSILVTSPEQKVLSVDGTKIVEKLQSEDCKVDGICSIIEGFMV